jgi:uncharacterized protein YqgV (UPF0045/DUF77 family)
MKKAIVVQIEKVVRETWVVDSEETAQTLLNGGFAQGMNYVKTGERVVTAEIYSQETKEVEFAPWDGYEK